MGEIPCSGALGAGATSNKNAERDVSSKDQSEGMRGGRYGKNDDHHMNICRAVVYKNSWVRRTSPAVNLER